MTSRNKFILWQVFKSFAPLLVIMLFFIPIDFALSTAEGPFSLFDFPWFIFALYSIEVINFLYNVGRLKKMDIDISLPENQTGSLNKVIQVALSKETVMQVLKQNVWKFKTEGTTELEEGTLIKMKYYKLTWDEKIELLVKELDDNHSEVKITAGLRKKSLSILPIHTFWNASIRHLQYFESVLQKREELRTALSPSV